MYIAGFGLTIGPLMQEGVGFDEAAKEGMGNPAEMDGGGSEGRSPAD